MAVKAWKLNDSSAPSFPSEFEVVKKNVLQKTDLNANNNKYYGLELHKAAGKYRVFTHYGRTDDLSRDPNAGMKECRYFDNDGEAVREYDRLYKAKTGDRKGYVEISLASSNIGSEKARGTSSGHIDEKTASKVEKPETPKAPKPVNVCPPGIRDLISLIYNEATTALTTTVQAKITAKGIETPLGVLTVGQIEKGEAHLKELFEAITAKVERKDLEKLSSQFYTAVPHKIGRTKAEAQLAVIDNKGKIAEKEETLQLMRDMLKVDGETHSVLVSDDLGDKYRALGAQVEYCTQGSEDFERMKAYAFSKMLRPRGMHIKNIYKVVRPGEKEAFKEGVGNISNLFHGSRIKNWVGLLTRGVLMPKLVTALGVNRTDGGWLGNGIYFGRETCTSIYYTSPGRGGHRIMGVHTVALGKMKDFHKITYGMNEPPKGFDSCHGVRGTEFSDTELCIYDAAQQQMQYLLEFTS